MALVPQGHDALVAAGYTFRGEGVCKTPECGAKILWYRAPSGQVMPIDYITLTPHWKSCAGAVSHRKKKEKAEPEQPAELQRDLFNREPGEE